jgi:hypothetical protein
MNARYDIAPRSCFILSKQPGGWVPWAVVAIEQPTPVGEERQQHPDRLCQRTGEMGDAGVHRDHEIQIRNERCGVGESLQRIAEMRKIALIFQYRRVIGADILLQTYKHRFDVQERHERVQADRTILIIFVHLTPPTRQGQFWVEISVRPRLESASA